ncbi:hypothetical protein FB451DRAFT_1549010 [Mycena latifolia]|nr:hypothetical protein FB451DRAFT_1549010 [Mycena latifolia]
METREHLRTWLSVVYPLDGLARVDAPQNLLGLLVLPGERYDRLDVHDGPVAGEERGIDACGNGGMHLRRWLVTIFVGRVLECGWRDEVARRGEWVVGLAANSSPSTATASTAYRTRTLLPPNPRHLPLHHLRGFAAILRIFTFAPEPRLAVSLSAVVRLLSQLAATLALVVVATKAQTSQVRAAAPPPPPPGLTLAELAGIDALANYTNTWESVDAVKPDGEVDVEASAVGEKQAPKGGGGGRRALVLQGHAGTGGLVARMLARTGWRVCVHAPGSLSDGAGAAAEETEADKAHMRRVQARVRAWGVEEVVFDDGGAAGERGTGGAARRCARCGRRGSGCSPQGAGRGRKQFTTAKDNFRAELRALRGSQGPGGKGAGKRSEVGTWTGRDVRDALGAVLRLPLAEGLVEAERPFDRAPEVFERGDGAGAVLRGGSVVVRVVG